MSVDTRTLDAVMQQTVVLGRWLGVYQRVVVSQCRTCEIMLVRASQNLVCNYNCAAAAAAFASDVDGGCDDDGGPMVILFVLKVFAFS